MVLRSALVAGMAFIAEQPRWLRRSDALLQFLDFEFDLFAFVHFVTSLPVDRSRFVHCVVTPRRLIARIGRRNVVRVALTGGVRRITRGKLSRREIRIR